MPKFGSRSKRNLVTCHEDLQDLFNEVIKYVDCSVIEGHRSKERQNKLYEEGWHITYWTARGGHTQRDLYDLTEKQLNEWGCKYDDIITGYSKINRKVSNLCTEIERSCDVNAGVHVYGSKGMSPSFPVHCDNFSNFIIQTVGSTYWKVYKNRHTSLIRTTNDKPLNYDTMEIDWEGILSPGDLLYIPNRAYHQAKPDEARLSMSIPCAPSVIDSNFYDRRYYQVQTNN